MTKENIPFLIKMVCDADIRTLCGDIVGISNITLGELETLYKEG